MKTQAGDIWAVPYMAREQWDSQPRRVWDAVERTVIEAGYGGKIQQARDIHGTDCYDPPYRAPFRRCHAETSDDLGAPIGQAFTVVVLRDREAVS